MLRRCVLATLLTLVGCGGPPAAGTPTAASREAPELVVVTSPEAAGAVNSTPLVVDGRALVIDAQFTASGARAVIARLEAALEELVREDYIQHSALAPDGRAGLLASLSTLRSLTIEPHRRLVDGELVMLHSTYTFPDGSQQVAFDVFRVEEGQLAEHWDGFQPLVPASETASGRSMVDGGL